MDYKSKYLKYHSKYLNLKKLALEQIGGVRLFPPELLHKLFEYMDDQRKIELMSETDFSSYAMSYDKPSLKDKYKVTDIFSITETRDWELIRRFNIDSIIIEDIDDFTILKIIVDDMSELRNIFNKSFMERIKSIQFIPCFNEPLGNILDNFVNLEEIEFVWGSYNHPLNDSLNKLKKLKKLILPSNFNEPLGTSLDNLVNLESLTFGYRFNQPIGNSLDKFKKLKTLILGDGYNTPLLDHLDKLTQLEILYMGEDYEFDLGNTLDKLINLKILTLSNSSMRFPLNNSLDNLVKLEELNLSAYYNTSLETYLHKLKNLRILNMGSMFNQELGTSLDGLDNIREINLGIEFSKSLEPLIKLPKLIQITIPEGYPLDIPDTLKDKISYND